MKAMVFGLLFAAPIWAVMLLIHPLVAVLVVALSGIYLTAGVHAAFKEDREREHTLT